jgi:hypothetical protein
LACGGRHLALTPPSLILPSLCHPTRDADTTRQSLVETRTQADKTIRDKNDMIAQLTQRIQSMETSYESVLNVRVIAFHTPPFLFLRVAV